MGNGRQREASASALVFYPNSLVGSDDGGKGLLLRSLYQQDWDDASSTDLLAWAICNRAQRPPNLPDATHAETSRGSPDQPLTDTTSETAAADCLWWSSVTEECRAKPSLP